MAQFMFAFSLGFASCAAVLWLWLGKELRRVMSARDEIDRALRDLNGLPPEGPVVGRHHPGMDPVEEHGGRVYLADNNPDEDDEGDGPGWAPWWDEAEGKGRGTTSRADEARDHYDHPDNRE